MLLKVVSLLALAATLTAAAPGPYAPAPSSYHGSGSATVTSYNRRGSASSSDSYSNKPAIYGTSYNSAPVAAPHYQRAPVSYAPPAPVNYAPAPAPANYAPHRQSAAYSGPAPAYAGYGPQTNAYSAHSQQLSHDPEYDAAKDPVSQYAAYVPVKEYGSKPVSSGNELSLYGYRK